LCLPCCCLLHIFLRPKDDVWSPDVFDAAAVELMRNLINRAKQPGHLYPMAMFSYPVMPPPKTVDKALGERRLTAWSGVGISVCEELDWQAVISGEGGVGVRPARWAGN
jgi:glycerol-3-phosphate O-acyltransferase